MRLVNILPVFLFLLVIVTLVTSLYQRDVVYDSPMLGKTMPVFELPSLLAEKQVVGNAIIKGKPCLINFFASWCSFCRFEHKYLLALSGEKLIPIYGIDVKDNVTAAKMFLKKYGNPYMDVGQDKYGHTALSFGISGYPETYIIDKNGVIIFQHKGVINESIYKERILPIIKQEMIKP